MLSLGARRVAVVHPGLFGGQSCDVGKALDDQRTSLSIFIKFISESVRQPETRERGFPPWVGQLVS
ncbi:hypothetical protein BDV26DRAFT_269167 [Aspergillus bertholletiae]|uniref:Uncharacterized protein n=1 Tax=Aspergillus bertholletiae TaxID=1226010 RepID=A0A5N7AYE4_9EURO|nr:hypothetical protein BDV26DRAFT_269167 [Aspergillus bertholletiae]